MSLRAFAACCFLLGSFAAPHLHAQPATSDAELERQFAQTVKPFVNHYCTVCHGGKAPAAQFDLRAYATAAQVAKDYPHWDTVLTKLNAGQMPPPAANQPTREAKLAVIAWVEAMRKNEARKTAGDPGAVLARRLSNAEYNYSIRDLTGVDIRPTREFPVDPANISGFDNSGESLTMSPALLNKYLQAAREVGDHMVLTPDGIDFSPYSALVETDRDKYAIERIIDFYARQPTEIGNYFVAAWRYKHRVALKKPNATLASTAAEAKVSPKYLPMVWDILETVDPETEVGPIAKLHTMWQAVPGPETNQPDLVRARCADMRDFVIRIRKHTAMQFAAPIVRGLPAGSQPLLDWKLRQFAAHRRDSDPDALRNDTDPQPEQEVVPKFPGLHKEAATRWAVVTANARAEDPDLVVPAAERARYQKAFERFASVFPDAFYWKERGRYFPDDSTDKGRYLSASYHNVMGYFRDDTPLSELILDEKGQRELDRLWDEFDFIAAHTARTWDQYYFNQSGEVYGKGFEEGSPRPADHAVTDTAVIFDLRDTYITKAQSSLRNDPVAVEAITEHFNGIDHTLRRMEKMHAEAEPLHLAALEKFAERAYRRPLSESQRQDLVAFYHDLRTKDGLSHEDAIRDSIVSVLMSPDFCYRLDLSAATPARASALTSVSTSSATRHAIEPLSNYDLASRLSYFLWSSVPDDKLLAHAKRGDLRNPAVLLSEVRRMLKDDRAFDLATEFTGNWLDFRHFEQLNTVDRQRFPDFTNDLREAMFQEPIRFMADVIQNNRSVLDLIYANRTFVNPVLAEHYGMPRIGDAAKWTRVDNANAYGHGGLLTMGAFLTQNAPGLRTSPVKRGVWVVRKVLGETIPSPPPNVPELPQDEGKLNLPLRDLLAKHRDNPACASCHARFDSLGLAFENYGPVGERRSADLAGHPVDTHAIFPPVNGPSAKVATGYDGSGIEGVRAYIRAHRQDDFLNNLSRKLLAYALGRSLQVSDDVTVERMHAQLLSDGFRFVPMVETIVTSPQFLNRRKPVVEGKPYVERSR